MIKVAIFAAAFFFWGNIPSTWDSESQKAFMDECVGSAKGAMGTDKAEGYCSCMLVRIMDTYPSALDAINMDMDLITEWGVDCVNCNWSKLDTEEFMEECVGSATEHANSDWATDYCSCMYVKMIVRFPEPLDVLEMTEAELDAMAEQCVK